MSFNRVLGLAPGDNGEVVLDTREEHEVAPGTIHFAVLATLAEVAAAGAAGRAVVPAALTVQLFRRARPGRLVGRGRLLRAGSRLVFSEGDVLQDDELVARATVTFAVLGASGGG